MTYKQSYSDDAACVLDCASPLALSLLSCSPMRNSVLPLQTERGAHASRVLHSASRQMLLFLLRHSNQGQHTREFPRNRMAFIALRPERALQNWQSASSLMKPIEGYSRLLKPFLKKYFFTASFCQPWPATHRMGRPAGKGSLKKAKVGKSRVFSKIKDCLIPFSTLDCKPRTFPLHSGHLCQSM
jgi:hypothetical protein